MIKLSRELVLRKLEMTFPDGVVAENALKSLERVEKHADAAAVEGVQLAIIKLCNGELWRLRELVKSARDDYQDVLSLAREPERFNYLRKMARPPAAGGSAKKPLTAAERAEMQKRDQRQWVEWLKS